VKSVQDLRERSADPVKQDRHTPLGIAPILRKLLTDGRTLANTVKVNRLDVEILLHQSVCAHNTLR